MSSRGRWQGNGGRRNDWQGGGRQSGGGGWNSRGGRGGGRGRPNATQWDSRGGGRARPNNDTNHGVSLAHDPTFEGADAAPDTEPALRVLAFHEQGHRIAFACYAEEENEIVFEDAASHGGRDTEAIIRGVLTECRPNLILVGNKVVANAPLLECLTTMPLGVEEGENTNDNDARGGQSGQRQQGTEESEGIGANGDSPSVRRGAAIPYQLLKSSAFEPRQCRSTILTKLRVLTLLRHRQSANPIDNFAHAQNYTPGLHSSIHGMAAQPPSSFHSLASMVDFDSPTLVRALGALLTYLRSTAFRLEEGFTVTVNDVRRCPASDSFLRLEESTLRTLRIFATDHHPLVANNNVKGRSYGKSKEGFSLFTLLDRTKSKAGRERLRQWMRQPLRDPNEIRKRHAGMELFLHPECHPAASLLLERLGDVGSMDAILLRMQRCTAQPNDFLVLGRMLESAHAIVAALGGELREKAYKFDTEDGAGMNGVNTDDGTQREYPSVNYVDELLRRCHVSEIRNLRERMASIIDEEVTAEVKDRVVINYGFHEELDRAKETFETLDETLSEVGRQVLARHQELISLKVVFLPQVGFLVSIDKRQHAYDEAANAFPNKPEDFEFVFVQDDDAFFKSDEMNQLDEEIGDLDAFIKDTEALIVSDLEEEVLERECELRATFGALADLDCVLSLAGCAADLGFVKPDIASASEGVIQIENGRHPLQELIVDDEFIPNDTAMDNSNRVLIVTGPNFSGKSCYARQVGVLVYLAHVGSYLPCDSAMISVMDQIIVNFGDVETCSVPQSTFQRDLTQMAGIMRKATPNTLVLIDEFGKGTAPTSGIAVMTSAMQSLARSGCKVVCTTHFLEMFSLGLLKDGIQGVKAVRMSIHVPESDEDDAVPLFKLEDGVAQSSAGLVCARMAGLNRKVVDRASDIISALKGGTQVKPLPESVNANSPFQPNVRSAIRLFLAVDSWASTADEDLELLQELVDRM